MSPVFTALMIPFLGTALGSAFVFFMKREMPALLQKVLLGFASGVMVAASVWSLLIPAMEMGDGASAVVAPVIGLLAGFAFLLLIDYITPHIHPGGDVNGPAEVPVFTYLKEAAPSEEYKGIKAKATQKLLKGLSKSVEKDIAEML